MIYFFSFSSAELSMLSYYVVNTKRYHEKIKLSFKIEIIFEISKKVAQFLGWERFF